MERLYPLNLRLAGRRVLIVGGGTLALQKLRGLESTGAAVRIVAPALVPGLGAGWPPERLELRRRAFRGADLAGCTLAFGATDDPAVNRRVVEAARRRGILANAVDDPPHCDFYTPSVLRRHGLELAISSGGGFPGLTRAVREVLEAWLPDEHGAAFAGLFALRRALLESPLPPAERGRVLRALAQRVATDYLNPVGTVPTRTSGAVPSPGPERPTVETSLETLLSEQP